MCAPIKRRMTSFHWNTRLAVFFCLNRYAVEFLQSGYATWIDCYSMYSIHKMRIEQTGFIIMICYVSNHFSNLRINNSVDLFYLDFDRHCSNIYFMFIVYLLLHQWLELILGTSEEKDSKSVCYNNSDLHG